MFSKKNILKILLTLLLIADIVYSFRQHEHKTLDGDMALITAPSKIYTDVINEPFGFKASLQHEKYAGAGRYYVHLAMTIYYKHLYPFFASFFDDKIDCLYKVTGLFHLVLQLLLIALIVYYACRNINFNSTQCLFIVVFISALFQTHGYAASIGVIDHSVTYAFFYAMPLAAFLLFLLPFLRWNIESKTRNIKIILASIWIPFAFILSMSGPIILPVGIMVVGTMWLYNVVCIIKNRKHYNATSLPYFTIITLSLFLLFCLYSYYVSTYNIENANDTSLSFRFGKLIEGLRMYFIKNSSFLLLAVLLLVNVFLFKKNNIKISWYIWLTLALALIYIFLLPFGGYRSYRPFIIRSDTFLPVTLLLFYLIARSTIIIISNTNYNKSYLVFIGALIGIFFYADKPHFDEDRCQIAQIKRLQQSKEIITVLPSDCPVLTWDCTKDTQWTADGARMLHYWKITDSIRIYKHE